MNGARGERAPVGARGGKPESGQGVGGRKRRGGGRAGEEGKERGGRGGAAPGWCAERGEARCERESWPPCR